MSAGSACGNSFSLSKFPLKCDQFLWPCSNQRQGAAVPWSSASAFHRPRWSFMYNLNCGNDDERSIGDYEALSHIAREMEWSNAERRLGWRRRRFRQYTQDQPCLESKEGQNVPCAFHKHITYAGVFKINFFPNSIHRRKYKLNVISLSFTHTHTHIDSWQTCHSDSCFNSIINHRPSENQIPLVLLKHIYL